MTLQGIGIFIKCYGERCVVDLLVREKYGTCGTGCVMGSNGDDGAPWARWCTSEFGSTSRGFGAGRRMQVEAFERQE